MDLNTANRRIKVIVLKVLRTKRGGSNGKRIGGTGRLISSVDTFLKLRSGNLEINIDALEYYRYLDLGTDKFEGWFFTEEIVNRTDFKKIVDNLALDIAEKKIDKAFK